MITLAIKLIGLVLVIAAMWSTAAWWGWMGLVMMLLQLHSNDNKVI